MNDLECIPEMNIAGNRLSEIHCAIIKGDYSALQGLLLTQSIVLHNLGMGFVEKSNEETKPRFKIGFMDLALRSLAQSQKTMATIKLMKK